MPSTPNKCRELRRAPRLVARQRRQRVTRQRRQRRTQVTDRADLACCSGGRARRVDDALAAPSRLGVPRTGRFRGGGEAAEVDAASEGGVEARSRRRRSRRAARQHLIHAEWPAQPAVLVPLLGQPCVADAPAAARRHGSLRVRRRRCGLQVCRWTVGGTREQGSSRDILGQLGPLGRGSCAVQVVLGQLGPLARASCALGCVHFSCTTFKLAGG